LYVYPKIDSLLDFITVAADLLNGNIYAGSYGGGLLEIRKDNVLQIYKQKSGLQPAIGDPGSYRVSGLAADINGNLWISNYGAPQNLVVKKTDNSWLRFTIPYFHTENAVAQIVIDDQNYKWILSPKGNGLFCFDDGGTLENVSDDRWRYFRQGKGNGNLPSAELYCLAKDRDGLIWIGTAKGIAVIQCMQDIFTSNACEAVLPVVQQDNFAGYLFADEEVRAIAVDGANRKWVGTRNGVWLISADGQKIINRFTETNSPLLSNVINSIAVHPQTGEVFISTFNGICSYRGSATEASETHSNVLVFPNPVPPGYGGTIAIRGLASDAYVKITESDGRLVFQTRALGGQAVWDGRNYKGEKIGSGVYLVLAADEVNKEKVVTKIFFIR
jgi:ligand-binding sensor domain-containing protein